MAPALGLANDEMQRTSHGQTGGSPLISVLCGPGVVEWIEEATDVASVPPFYGDLSGRRGAGDDSGVRHHRSALAWG